MEGSLEQIPLNEIGDAVGTPPSQRLKESVARMGVLQPVMLARKTDDAGEIRLTVIDGNRRIGAARAANMSHVPAIVFEGIEPTTVAETTLATNHFRSSNYLAEFWALKHLERANYAHGDIVAASGMNRSSLELRNTLSGLNRELFVALRNGQINQTDATAVARLDAHQQEELAERFRQNGALKRKDIQEISPPEAPSGNEIATQLRNAATEANKLGYNRAEFLEMAAREWDTIAEKKQTNANQTPDEQVMRDQLPTEPFPDLAAHKWDTGEG